MKRSKSRGRRIIFWVLSLLMVLSMLLGLILTAIPQPKQPTPTPLPRITLIPMPTLTPTVTPTGS